MTHPETREERFLLDAFGEHIVGLIQYGSTVFGETRKGSACDFWVIVRDLRGFHGSPAMLRVHAANNTRSVDEHIRMNRSGPNFYGIQQAGLNIKIAVIVRATFIELCRADFYYVKGRMQKPLRVICADPGVWNAIMDARRQGTADAVDLLPADFGLAQFLFTLLSLSYRAEIRPELTGKKIASILRSGGGQLHDIYRPLLERHASVMRVAPERYRDTRHPAAQRRAQRRTLRRIHRQKWSRRHLATIWKNYQTHGSPLQYMSRKIAGELEKYMRGRKRR